MNLVEGKPKEIGAYFTRCVNNGDVYYKIQCLISEDHLEDSSWTDYKYVTHYINLEDVEEDINQ